MNLFRAGGRLLAQQRSRASLRCAFGAWRCSLQRRLQIDRQRARRVSRRLLTRLLGQWSFLREARRDWLAILRWRRVAFMDPDAQLFRSARWALWAWRCIQQRRRHYWTRRARQIARKLLRYILREWRFLGLCRQASMAYVAQFRGF